MSACQKCQKFVPFSGRICGDCSKQKNNAAMKYLIYSHNHNNHGRDGVATFWRPDCLGYTADLDEAGRYSEAEAKRIVGDGATTAMIGEHHFEAIFTGGPNQLKIERVVRMDVGINRDVLKAFITKSRG